MSIFADHARRYWELNLPAIPLILGQKRPAISAWQEYACRMPTPEEQTVWLHAYADANIGLPLGPQSDLMVIDIDTTDPAITAALNSVIPASPWVRVGAKGEMRAYRFNPNITGFNIKHPCDGMIVELLTTGRQCVLSPSIHPDTQRPYESNVDLLDVVSIIPDLPITIEALIREALKPFGIEQRSGTAVRITDNLAPGTRDDGMMRKAGLLAMGVRRGEMTFLRARDVIYEAGESFADKVPGDSFDPAKGVAKLVEFLGADIAKGRTLPSGWDEGLTEEDKESYGITEWSNNERWSYEKIDAFLTEQLASHSDPRSSGFRSAVKFALEKLANNPDIVKSDEALIVSYVKAASKKRLTKDDIQRQLSALSVCP
jgi:putative DNA primase/helicase